MTKLVRNDKRLSLKRFNYVRISIAIPLYKKEKVIVKLECFSSRLLLTIIQKIKLVAI
jgi:hypothetical protein